MSDPVTDIPGVRILKEGEKISTDWAIVRYNTVIDRKDYFDWMMNNWCTITCIRNDDMPVNERFDCTYFFLREVTGAKCFTYEGNVPIIYEVSSEGRTWDALVRKVNKALSKLSAFTPTEGVAWSEHLLCEVEDTSCISWYYGPSNVGKTTVAIDLLKRYPERVAVVRSAKGLHPTLLEKIRKGWIGDTVILDLCIDDDTPKMYDPIRDLFDGCIMCENVIVRVLYKKIKIVVLCNKKPSYINPEKTHVFKITGRCSSHLIRK